MDIGDFVIICYVDFIYVVGNSSNFVSIFSIMLVVFEVRNWKFSVVVEVVRFFSELYRVSEFN